MPTQANGRGGGGGSSPPISLVADFTGYAKTSKPPLEIVNKLSVYVFFSRKTVHGFDHILSDLSLKRLEVSFEMGNSVLWVIF